MPAARTIWQDLGISATTRILDLTASRSAARNSTSGASDVIEISSDDDDDVRFHKIQKPLTEHKQLKKASASFIILYTSYLSKVDSESQTSRRQPGKTTHRTRSTQRDCQEARRGEGTIFGRTKVCTPSNDCLLSFIASYHTSQVLYRLSLNW